MNSHEKFTNWLEGLLDACKNKPTVQHVKDIRKKLESLKVEERAASILNLQVPSFKNPTFGLGQAQEGAVEKFIDDDDFQRAIEKNKAASTMEELFED